MSQDYIFFPLELWSNGGGAKDTNYFLLRRRKQRRERSNIEESKKKIRSFLCIVLLLYFPLLFDRKKEDIGLLTPTLIHFLKTNLYSSLVWG